jgi:cytochrome P450
VLTDPRFSRAATIMPKAPRFSAVDFPAGSLFTMDPPEHTRLRKLVAGQFTPRRVESLVTRIQQVTDGLLDTLAASPQPADLNVHLAFQLPVIVICDLLGVPSGDRDRFRSWADASVSLTPNPAAAVHEQKEMAFYFSQLIEKKRMGGGGEDLLKALIAAHDEQGRLSQLELIVMAMSLLVAGFETTGSVIGTGVLTMLCHPELPRRLAEEPGAIEPIVEEILRFNPIGDGGPVRIALEDVDIAGVPIAKGSLVIASVSSANFDTAQFPEADVFDADRQSNRHLAFGHGVHFCVGAALARVELRIAIASLFKRFPTLRLAAPLDSLKMRSGGLFHRLERLPVTW